MVSLSEDKNLATDHRPQSFFGCYPLNIDDTRMVLKTPPQKSTMIPWKPGADLRQAVSNRTLEVSWHGRMIVMEKNESERVIGNVRPDAFALLFKPSIAVHLAAFAALCHPGLHGLLAREMLARELIDPGKTWLTYALPLAALLRVLYLYLLDRSQAFALTDERLIVRYGIFLRIEDEIELYRVNDVIQSVNIAQRLFGIGTVHVASTDRTGTVVLPGIRRPSAVRNAIRTAAERCKNRRGTVRILE
jgi:hypothetical protein